MTDLTRFDASEFLGSRESEAFILSDALASGDRAYIANALGTIARARGMTRIAEEAGITREALYRSLSAAGDPKLSTLLGVIAALGMRLHASEVTDAA